MWTLHIQGHQDCLTNPVNESRWKEERDRSPSWPAYALKSDAWRSGMAAVTALTAGQINLEACLGTLPLSDQWTLSRVRDYWGEWTHLTTRINTTPWPHGALWWCQRGASELTQLWLMLLPSTGPSVDSLPVSLQHFRCIFQMPLWFPGVVLR